MEQYRYPDTYNLRLNVAAVCQLLGACAAGYWRLDQASAQLVQVAFVPGRGLDAEVGRKFESATEVVPLSQQSLGIVAAASTGRPAISRVSELPADSGSGTWLRAFGASRSVAVPLFDAEQTVCGVISVALPEHGETNDDLVASHLRRAMELLISA